MDKLHPSLAKSFKSLPSDPNTPLRKEQLEALFPHPEVWRDVIALTLKQKQIEPEQVQISEAELSDS